MRTMHHRIRRHYACCFAHAGWAAPQIQIQFKPLSWGLGVGLGTHKAALVLGPLAVAVWFRFGDFEAIKVAEMDRR